MNQTNTSDDVRASGDRRSMSSDRREDRGVSERRLVERRGMLASMADALQDILRAEVRAGVYRPDAAQES